MKPKKLARKEDDPGKPQVKRRKLKTIKKNLDKKKKKGVKSAAVEIASDKFLEFNGIKATGSKEQIKEKKVAAFFKAKKQIKQWMEKDAKIDSAKVLNLGKKLLEPEEMENARVMSEEFGTYLYIAVLGLLDARLNNMEEDLLKDKRGAGDEEGKNEEIYQEFKILYKEEMKKDGRDPDAEPGMEVEEKIEELDKDVVNIKEQINEWEGYGEDEWQNVLKEEGEDKAEDKKEEEINEEEKDDEVIKAYIQSVEKGEIKLEDEKKNMLFFDNLNKDRIDIRNNLNKVNGDFSVKNNLTKEQFAGLDNANLKKYADCSCDQMKYVADLLIAKSNGTENTFMWTIIRSLAEKCKKLEETVEILTKSLKKKVELDEQHVVKEKGNAQMKKIFRGDYIPQKEWNELSNVDKALHNVKDFAQFPKPTIWKTFSADEKLKFFEGKLQWNLDRARFIRLLAEGKNLDKDLLKYKWNANISLSRAITCNLYYGDKFSDGHRVREFSELWKKANKKLRISCNTERGKIKEILIRLNKSKPIQDAVLYHEGWFLKINGLYWDNDLEKLAKIANDKYARNKAYWDSKKARESSFLGKKKEKEDDVPYDAPK